MRSNLILILSIASCLLVSCNSNSEGNIGASYTEVESNHPSLILTKAGANQIKKGGSALLVERSMNEVVAQVEAAIAIDVPVPKDMSGRYIEPQEIYGPICKIPLHPFSNIESLDKKHHDKDYTIFSVITKDETTTTFGISNKDAGTDSNDQITANGQSYKWTGPFYIIKS